MGMYLNIGNDGFKSIRKGLYVDKTGLISYINATLGTEDKLTCISRPRRFGKSFAAKMLCAYYDKSCDSKDLFCGLQITKDPSYARHLNQYDVLYLDITWFISAAPDLQHTLSFLQEQVTAELCSAFPAAAPQPSLPVFLARISREYKRRFIIIIDEWDALFREAKQDAETVAACINEVHCANTSVIAYNNELSLSCIITIAYYAARREYTFIRELPSGKGFADIALIPEKQTDKPAILIELKWNQSAHNVI